MAKCEKCGKDTISFYELGEHKLCLSCYTNLSKEEEQKLDKDSKKKTLHVSNNNEIFKLQLQAIMQMKRDVSLIKNIMLFYLILFLLAILLLIIL